MTLRKILVPVDFSASSLAALRYAIDLSRKLRATLAVVHVVEPLTSAVPTALYGEPIDLGPLLDEQERAAKAELARLGKRLARRRVKADLRLARGVAWSEIAAVARRTKASLIVMATHGRTGLSHLFLGSVAERVVRSAPCPVLTLRTQGETRGR